MNKIITYVLFILILCQYTLSQDMSFGFNGGISSSSDKPFSKIADYMTATYGLAFNHYLKKGISYSIGLNYEQSGFYYWDSESEYDESNNIWIYYDCRHKYEFHNVSLPIVFRPYFGEKVRFYGNIGTDIKVFLKGINYETRIEYNNESSERDINFKKINITDEMTRIDVGIILGTGLDFYLTPKISIGGDVYANIGLRKLGEDLINYNYNLLSLKLNLKYHLKQSEYYTKYPVTDSIKIGNYAIYAELLGNSFIGYSLNYLQVLKKYRLYHMYFTAGFGYNRAKDGWKSSFVIPVSYNVVKGIKSHFLEFGLGLTFSHNGSQSHVLGYNDVKSASTIYSTQRIGYKFQPKEKGIYGRIGFTSYLRIIEFYDQDQSIIFAAIPGISLGIFIK